VQLFSRYKHHSSAPHVALILVQLFFGTWPVVGKIVLRSIPSTGLVAFRVTGAAVAFAILRRRLGRLGKLSKRDLAWLVLCSLLGVILNQFLFVKGLSLTTVINATLLGTTIPVFTLVISIALGHDRPSLRRVAGILLAAAGVIYLVDPLRATFSSETTMGNVLIVANSLSYGAYIAISGGLFRRYGALNVITLMFLIGAIVTLPVGGLTLDRERLESAGLIVWLSLVYIVVVPTVGAYYLNAWALTKVRPSTVATYIYLQPLIAFSIAPLVLGEKWNSRTLIASLLIFAGVGLVTKRGRSSAVKEVAEHPEALAH